MGDFAKYVLPIEKVTIDDKIVSLFASLQTNQSQNVIPTKYVITR